MNHFDLQRRVCVEYAKEHRWCRLVAPEVTAINGMRVDVVAISGLQYRSPRIEVVEVKVQRSDLLRELKYWANMPTKAAERYRASRFILACTPEVLKIDDLSVSRDSVEAALARDEVPPDWGVWIYRGRYVEPMRRVQARPVTVEDRDRWTDHALISLTWRALNTSASKCPTCDRPNNPPDGYNTEKEPT